MVSGSTRLARRARGDAQFIGRGVAHDSKNTGGKPIDFVIVAIK
jgi:oxalate decarboxylase/phosphoglucose isomerase-like protein (cupin superfamily)